MASTQTSTMTQNTAGGSSYAPWIGSAQKGLAGLGFGLNQQFLQPNQDAIAGFNPDQQKGFDMLRGSALQYGQSNGAPSIADITGSSHATATNSNAAQLGPNGFQPFMNPYVESVINPALADMRRQRDISSAEIGARSAAAGSFGGSREAIQRGQLDRSLGEQTSQLVPSLLSAAYDRAQALASGNVDRQQASNQQNASLGTQVGLSNAGNSLAAYGIQNNLQSSDLNRQLTAINALLGGGKMQQDLVQRNLDVPNERLKLIASLIPGVYDVNTWQTTDQTSTKPDDSPSPFSQLLGMGSSILGGKTADGGTVAGSIFSKLFG